MALANINIITEDRASGAQVIDGSLRFDSSQSHNLQRATTRSASNAAASFSVWVKLSDVSTTFRRILTIEGSGGSDFVFTIAFVSNQLFVYDSDTGGADANAAQSGNVLRDASAWYHIFYARTAGGTDGTIYINGVEKTKQTTNATNIDLFSRRHDIGQRRDNTGHFDGYMSQFYAIDGQRLEPTDFGFTDPLTNTWRPKKYTGTFGDMGYYLPMDNQSDFEIDKSGNRNDFTKNNFSGTFNDPDVLPDSPSGISYSTDSISGITTASQRKPTNWCTLNPLKTGPAYTLSEGNLAFSAGSNWDGSCGTISASSGKWYYELTRGSGTSALFGWCISEDYDETTEPGDPANSSVWRYRDDGTKRNGEGSGQSYGATWTADGSVAGCALDLDAGTIRFFVNGVDQGIAYSNLAGNTVTPVVAFFNGNSTVNFGQKPFRFTPPDGFQPLCLANLPRPSAVALQPEKHFKCLAYAGSGSSGATQHSFDFKPDLVWIKQRTDNGVDHCMFYSTVGADRVLRPNKNLNVQSSTDRLNSFDSNGFTLGDSADTNASSKNYVAWCWKCGDGGDSSNRTNNNDGDVQTNLQVNREAGFSIVTFIGNNSNDTMGHGLGQEVDFVMAKPTSVASTDWEVYCSALGVDRVGTLNGTSNWDTQSDYWGAQSDWTATTCGLGAGTHNHNDQDEAVVWFCWHEVTGYSKFSTYTGNGSADGAFVELGFKPAWLLIKRVNNSDHWALYDTARSTTNANILQLNTDLPSSGSNGAENNNATNNPIDFLSNGFKLRTSDSRINGSEVYFYAAFAEAPTFNLYGGQANAR